MKGEYLSNSIISSFIKKLEKELLLESIKVKKELDYQEWVWLLKDVTTKFAWLSMVEKRTDKYKVFKEQLK